MGKCSTDEITSASQQLFGDAGSASQQKQKHKKTSKAGSTTDKMATSTDGKNVVRTSQSVQRGKVVARTSTRFFFRRAGTTAIAGHHKPE
eukprot:1504804-Amphidinium_carterae.1